MILQYVKCAGAKLGDIIITEAMSVSLAELSSEGIRLKKNCFKNIEMLLDVFGVKYIQA